MSKYFKPLDLPELDAPATPAKPRESRTYVLPNDRKLTEAQMEVQVKKEADELHSIVVRMMSDVEGGRSSLCKMSIQLSRSPLAAALARFQENPTPTSLLEMLKMTKENVNYRFYVEVKNLITSGQYSALMAQVKEHQGR